MQTQQNGVVAQTTPALRRARRANAAGWRGVVGGHRRGRRQCRRRCCRSGLCAPPRQAPARTTGQGSRSPQRNCSGSARRSGLGRGRRRRPGWGRQHRWGCPGPSAPATPARPRQRCACPSSRGTDLCNTHRRSQRTRSSESAAMAENKGSAHRGAPGRRRAETTAGPSAPAG